MLVTFQLLIYICLGLQMSESTNLNTDITIEYTEEVWKMARAFGSKINAKSWVFHYEASESRLWKSMCQKFFKEKNIVGNFIANEIQYLNSTKLVGVSTNSNAITLHLYLHRDLQPLNTMLSQESVMNSNKSFNQGMLGNVHSNLWLIQMPKNATKEYMEDMFLETPLQFDTMAFAFTLINGEEIIIYDAYRLSIDTETLFRYYGSWKNNSSLHVAEPSIWTRRGSLDGFHLRTASAYNPPAVTYIENSCSAQNCFQGMFPDIWHALSARMNFTFTVERAYEWGSVVNGTWSGMIGMLNKNQIDIAVADLTITSERSTTVNFLPPLTDVNEQLFLKNPEDAFHLRAFIEPLTNSSWLVVILFTLLIPPILAVIAFYDNDEKSSDYQLSGCYCFVTKTLIMESSGVLPRINSSRIAFVTVILASMMLYFHWEAMLISYLAVRKPKLPFTTLEELSENSNYKLLIGRGTSQLDQFRHSTNPIYRKIWKEKLEPHIDKLPLYKDLISAILKDPDSVAYAEAGKKQNDAYRHCQFIDTGTNVYTSQLAWAIPKHSPYDGIFTYNINKLKEIGVVERYSLKYSTQDQFCASYSGKPLGIKQCFTAFTALLVGILAGSLWLGLEIFTPKMLMESILTFGDRTFLKIMTKIRPKYGTSNISVNNKYSRCLKNNEVCLKQMKHFQNYLEIFDEMNTMKQEFDKKESALRKAISSHENTERDLQQKITNLLFEISLLKNKKKRKNK